MEVKINKEIQSYSESLFFGLSMRQCGFSLAAVLSAIGLYFLLKPYVGAETVSWMCILGAAPFAAMGFVSYHGMTAEQLVWTWFRSEILEPKRLISEPDNLYCKLVRRPVRIPGQRCISEVLRLCHGYAVVSAARTLAGSHHRASSGYAHIL